MSDYMFMLESHLTAQQNRVLTEVRKAAADAQVNLFLTGGAVRDMLGGFVIRDLDFTIEGNAVKLAKTIAAALDAETVRVDDNRKVVSLIAPGQVTFEIGMARQERFTKTGGKPQVTPATIQEDLQRRDFTVNALALSLNKGSRGLLLDPTNGMGDLDRHELRTTNNYAFYDSPVRLMRLHRYRVRLEYKVSEKTQSQYENAREAEIDRLIRSEDVIEELRYAAREPNPVELLHAWEQAGFLAKVTPALSGAALNEPVFTKLQKLRPLAPFGVDLETDEVALFFAILTEKLPPKERAKIADLEGEHSAVWLKLEARAKKLEKEASGSLSRPSQVYNVLSKVPGDVLFYALLRSQNRAVQERGKNYLQKYLPTAQEVTDQQVEEAGYKPGTAKFEKAKAEMISKRLNARPKKVEPEPEQVTPAQ